MLPCKYKAMCHEPAFDRLVKTFNLIKAQAVTKATKPLNNHNMYKHKGPKL